MSTFAVGLSGGPDSVALACCAAQHARTHHLSLHFFHVDHGLHPLAAAWTRAAEQVGHALGIPVHVARVHVDLASGEGIEAAARHARYRALAALAQQHGASPVLLAHHQDDQVETVLHRLLRGSGIDGVRGMRSTIEAKGAHFLRPWLALPRALLLAPAQAWAAHHGIELADDPSNLDTRYARGALRRDVLPGMAAHWPGYRTTLTRFAQHAETAAAVLQEVAQSDLAQISELHDSLGACLRLSGLLALSPARQTLVLRAWLDACHLQMPTEARLQALCVQLRDAGVDRQPVWTHQGCTVRRYRDWVVLMPAESTQAADREQTTSPVELTWRGEASLHVDAFDGVLHFESVPHGIDPAWLQAGPLAMGVRRGSERLQIRAGSPSRSLKNLYQEAGVPAWARDRLPLLYRDEQLIHVAGLGSDVRVPHATPGIRLLWTPNRPTVVLPA
ncbi:tRNA lysidine(34) synthetase TilS [Pigmentiphaga aceris]|uniref:tRNA lysidine(34) synthetase TilS n=1 Tax=Pigmentiphaga aceris TaxID=1940612 RepID=UPI00165228AD|nr:tRNA lysidine(34) synthetase TilS [Pigmentiphaga aceris]